MAVNCITAGDPTPRHRRGSVGVDFLLAPDLSKTRTPARPRNPDDVAPIPFPLVVVARAGGADGQGNEWDG